MWHEVKTQVEIQEFSSIQKGMNEYYARLYEAGTMPVMEQKIREGLCLLIYRDPYCTVTMAYEYEREGDRYRITGAGVGRYEDINYAARVLCERIRDLMVKEGKPAYGKIGNVNFELGTLFYNAIPRQMAEIGVSCVKTEYERYYTLEFKV
jgi:hypothetical protein